MRARRHRFWRRLQDERDKGLVRLLSLLATVLGMWGGLFAAAFFAGRYVLSRGAPEVLPGGVAVTLLGVMGALFFSSVGHAATAFFAARDLWFWDASPTSVTASFGDRVIETLTLAAPATVGLSSSLLLGFVIGGTESPGAVARAGVGLVAVVVLTVVVAAVVAHVVAAVFPAGAVSRASVVLLGIALCVALVLLRQSGVERLVTEKGAEEFVAKAGGLFTVGPPRLPHNAAAQFVIGGDLVAGGWLLLWVAGAVAVARLVYGGLYKRARTRAEQDNPSRDAKGLVERVVAFYARRSGPSSGAMVRKDLLAFVRDPSQWGQLVLLLTISIVYVVNCRALVAGFGDVPQAGGVILSALHVGVVGFVAAGLAARFAFVQMALEGPAMWLAWASPLSPRGWVEAKRRAALPIVFGFPVLTAILGAVALDLDVGTGLLSVLLSAGIAWCCVAMGVARGSVAPLFDAASVGEMAMGPGAMLTMLRALFLSGVGAGLQLVTAGLTFFLGAAARGGVAAVVGGLFCLWTVRFARRQVDAGGAAVARWRHDPP